MGRLVANYCRANSLELNTAIRAHAHHVAIALAARGMGVAVIDWFTAQVYMANAAANDLIILPLAPEATLPVTAAHFATEGLPLAARRFVEAVQGVLKASGLEVGDKLEI